MDELISVVVPIYNTNADVLNECLYCIKNQSYNSIEVLCVDSSSDNNTKNVIDKYLSDSRFKRIDGERGVSNQRNIGLKESKGKYVLFVDSDDFFDSNFLLHLYNKIIETDSDIAIPLIYRNEFLNGKPVKEIPYEVHQISEKVNEQNYFKYCRSGELVNPIKLYKRSLIENARFRNESTYGEDLIFNFELSKSGYKTVFVPDSIYHYRVNILNNSASRRLDKKGLFIVKYLADIIRAKTIKSKESIAGLYAEFDFVFNSFFYALARQKKISGLFWMTRYKCLYLKRHHGIHDILYLTFPIIIVARRSKKKDK